MDIQDKKNYINVIENNNLFLKAFDYIYNNKENIHTIPNYWTSNFPFKKNIHLIHLSLLSKHQRIFKNIFDTICHNLYLLHEPIFDESWKENAKLDLKFTAYIINKHLKTVNKENDYDYNLPQPTYFEYIFNCLTLIESKNGRLLNYLNATNLFTLPIAFIEISNNSRESSKNIHKSAVINYFKYTTIYNPIMFLIYILRQGRSFNKLEKGDLDIIYKIIYEHVLKPLNDDYSLINKTSAKILLSLYTHCKNMNYNNQIETLLKHMKESKQSNYQQESDRIKPSKPDIEDKLLFELINNKHPEILPERDKYVILNLYNDNYFFALFDYFTTLPPPSDDNYSNKEGEPTSHYEERRHEHQFQAIYNIFIKDLIGYDNFT